MSLSRWSSRRRTCRLQRGSSVIVIFIVLTVMSSLALAVLLTTRSDIKVSGYDREGAVAFSAAEAGIAYGKSFLTTQWNPTTGWSTLLASSVATTGVTASYDFGGVSGMPRVKARYRYWFVNNASDSSGQPTVDTDGRIVIMATGDALDPAGTTVVATATVQLEVFFSGTSQGKADYQGQQNQDVSGSAKSQPDTSALSGTTKKTF